MKTLSAVGFLLVLGCNREPCEDCDSETCEPEPTISVREACLLIADVQCNTCSDSLLNPDGTEQTPEECLADSAINCATLDKHENWDYAPQPVDWPDCLDECLADWGRTKNGCHSYLGNGEPYACGLLYNGSHYDYSSVKEICANGPFHESECGYTLAE